MLQRYGCYKKIKIMEYKYRLQKYDSEHKKILCPECGKRTFVPYVESVTGEVLNPRVGRCDREINCGYHLTPKEYFGGSGGGITIDAGSCGLAQKEKPIPISFVDSSLVEKSMTGSHPNYFISFLQRVFGVEAAAAALARYRIGTSTKWSGATIFWQIDHYQRVRTGKIMLYDENTGKRVKNGGPKIGWVHTHLGFTDFHLRQCLFGEHLLDLPGSSNQICLVESEKTAVICSIRMPQFTWLATGGIQNLRDDTCAVLAHRNVLIFPDLGAEDVWKEKKNSIPALRTALITPMLRDMATDEDVKEGLDLADFVLRDE